MRELPILLGLAAFQAAVGIGIAAADVLSGAARENALYAAALQAGATLLYAALRAAARHRERRRLEAASAAPLDAPVPEPASADGESWAAYARTRREAALQLLGERETEAAEDAEAAVAAVHGLKIPAAALGLMADAALRTGEPLDPRAVRLEAEELDRLLGLSLSRYRLRDFEADSLVEELDAATLVSESLRRLRRIFLARGIAVGLPERGAALWSDRKWLSFILDQLLENGAKYARTRVDVRLEADRDRVSIAVEDDGPGIPAEARSRIFAPSFVGEGGRSSDAAGLRSSGYGLYLAAKAAEKLGAELRLEFAEGGGTTATLRVPCRKERW